MGAHTPLVSIVLPTHDRCDLLRQAVASVQAQEHSRWQLLIIDDGSNDRTAEIQDAYAERDARIRVIHQENVDQPATLNRGLSLAKHVCVAILDLDDVCVPERLERRIEEPEKSVGSRSCRPNPRATSAGCSAARSSSYRTIMVGTVA